MYVETGLRPVSTILNQVIVSVETGLRPVSTFPILKSRFRRLL